MHESKNHERLVVGTGAGIYNKNIGVVYFLFCLNRQTKKYILMLENVPFTIGSGTFVRYLNERLECIDKKNQIESNQIAGKDFEAYLNSIGNSYIDVANIRLKKYVSNEKMQQIGVVDDILKSAKDKDFEVELRLVWNKKKRPSVTSLLQSVLKKEQISEIALTNFSELFRTFSFETDNSVQPKVDLLDSLLRFEADREKLDMSNDMIYTQMYSYFITNKTQIV